MSVNKVILIGNVGKDPEVKYLDKGSAVANFTLATTERGFKTASGQEIPEKTEWHNITAWRGLAEIAEKYIKKGSKLYIEGKIRTRSYDDASGNKKYVTEIIADSIEMLDRRPGTDNTPASAYSQPQAASSPIEPLIPTNDQGADDLPF